MKFGLFRFALPLFDSDPGGPPAAPAAPAAATPPVSPAAPAPQPGSGQPSAAPAAQPHAPAPGFTYKEDRSNWVPSHVVRQRTQEYEKVQRELDFERRRVAALTGVQMPTQADPESDAIRSQFAKMFPGLAKLEAMADKLEKAAGFDYDGIQNSQTQVWQSHGNQVLQTLQEKVKAAYGGADLTPKALSRICGAFVNEIAQDDELKSRYEAGDMRIIDEFITDFTGAVLDPYKRQTTAAAAPGFQAARRLPRGGGSSPVVGGRPATLKPSDEGFHNAAFARFNQGQ